MIPEKQSSVCDLHLMTSCMKQRSSLLPWHSPHSESPLPWRRTSAVQVWVLCLVSVRILFLYFGLYFTSYFAFLAVQLPLALLTVEAVMTSLPVKVNLSVTVETPHPSLAPTLPAGHPSCSPTLVARLDHSGVGDGHQPHLVPEHPPRPLVYLPGQRSRALRHLRSLQVDLGVGSVRSVAPAGLSPLGEGLELVVESGHVLHLRDHHLLGRLPPVAHVGAHVVHQVGPSLLLRQRELGQTPISVHITWWELLR